MHCGSPFVCARQRAADLLFSISWQSLAQQTEQERPLILLEMVDVAVCALIDVSVDCTDNKVDDLCVSFKKRNNHKASWVQFSEPGLILGLISVLYSRHSISEANLISSNHDNTPRFLSSRCCFLNWNHKRGQNVCKACGKILPRESWSSDWATQGLSC